MHVQIYNEDKDELKTVNHAALSKWERKGWIPVDIIVKSKNQRP